MSNKIFDIGFFKKIPRELSTLIIDDYANYYKQIWQKNIQNSLQEITKLKPTHIWSTHYNLHTKFYYYNLYGFENKWINKPNRITNIITNYSEDTYKLENINFKEYFLRLYIETFSR